MRVSIKNQDVTRISGDLEQVGFADGPGMGSLFDHPDGITCLGGYLYVADTYNHRIRVIDLATRRTTTLIGGETAGHRDGTFEEARIKFPQKIIAIPIAQGSASTLHFRENELPIGGLSRNGFREGSSSTARSEAGLLVFTEMNDAVRIIDLERREVSTLIGNFSSTVQNGYKDGDQRKALLNFPYGIAAIDAHTLLITESDNHTVREIQFWPSEGSAV